MSAGTLAPVSATAPTRCRSCGRETTTTEDGRCDYCGQPKLLADEQAERAAAQPVAADEVAEPAVAVDEPPPAESLRARDTRPAPDLRPQYAAAALAAVIAVVGLLMRSELLLIAAAIVLVVAVAAAIIDDGW